MTSPCIQCKSQHHRCCCTGCQAGNYRNHFNPDSACFQIIEVPKSRGRRPQRKEKTRRREIEDRGGRTHTKHPLGNLSKFRPIRFPLSHAGRFDVSPTPRTLPRDWTSSDGLLACACLLYLPTIARPADGSTWLNSYKD